MECESSDRETTGATSGGAGSGRLTCWGARGAAFASMVGEWLTAHTTQRWASRVLCPGFGWMCRASATETNSNTAMQQHAAMTASVPKRRFCVSSSTASIRCSRAGITARKVSFFSRSGAKLRF